MDFVAAAVVVEVVVATIAVVVGVAIAVVGGGVGVKDCSPGMGKFYSVIFDYPQMHVMKKINPR